MSSLAATQADGYYLPPEYYDSGKYKKQSKNQFHASQHGGKVGHNQFLQSGIVRFELPFKGVCQGCQTNIERGTRYNASKVQNGSYFTTQIWEFRMNCRNCRQEFVIRTDPAKQSFENVEGIVKRAGIDGELVRDDPVSSLERMEVMQLGKRRALTEREELERLQRANDRLYRNDADGNAVIRSRFRQGRNQRKRRLREGETLGWKNLPLLESTVEDDSRAKTTVFGDGKRREAEKLKVARTSSIFSRKTLKRNGHRECTGDNVKPDSVASNPSSSSRCRTRLSSQTVDLTETVVASPKKVRLISVGVSSRSRLKNASRNTLPAASSALDALVDYESDSE